LQQVSETQAGRGIFFEIALYYLQQVSETQASSINQSLFGV